MMAGIGIMVVEVVIEDLLLILGLLKNHIHIVHHVHQLVPGGVKLDGLPLIDHKEDGV